MRRWERWFFRPGVQLTFWLLVAMIGLLVVTGAVRRAVEKAQAWRRPEPVITAPRDRGASASPLDVRSRRVDAGGHGAKRARAAPGGAAVQGRGDGARPAAALVPLRSAGRGCR